MDKFAFHSLLKTGNTTATNTNAPFIAACYPVVPCVQMPLTTHNAILENLLFTILDGHPPWPAVKVAISKCSPETTGGGNYEILGSCVKSTPSARETLVDIIQASLTLPKLVPPIPLLKVGDNRTILMSREQVHSILSNAFFCTFPEHPKTYPGINFTNLFSDSGSQLQAKNIRLEKLKCIFNYFEQIKNRNGSPGNISFERRCLEPEEIPDWKYSNNLLQPVEIRPKGRVEDAGSGYSQVNFANKYIGGGILGNGAVQEEIRFSICPELIVARLFTERLGDREVVVITGAERFSHYSGYGHSFKYEGPHRKGAVPRGSITEIVAMDALDFSNQKSGKWSQFKMNSINRELNKCFCAFMTRGAHRKQPRKIASGNWGCGAFKGDPQLKFVIQWMAATEAGRSLAMFGVGGECGRQFTEMSEYLIENGATVGKVYEALEVYCYQISEGHRSRSRSPSRGRKRSRSRSRSPSRGKADDDNQRPSLLEALIHNKSIRKIIAPHPHGGRHANRRVDQSQTHAVHRQPVDISCGCCRIT